nr:hypothetical protein [Nitrospirota bacterium]
MEYPTRRPRERPRQYPLIIKQDGRERTIDVPIEEYLPIIVLPVFDVPGYVEDRDALRAIGLTAPVQVGGPSIRQLAEKYGSDGGVQVSYQGYALAQLLAKIAYGFAIAKYGLGKIQVAYVVPGILEKEKNIGRWVGCDRKLSRFLDPGNEPHAIRIFRNKENDIIGRVRLFAEFETPEYIVNVGRLKESVAVHLPKDRTKRRGKEAG